MRAIPLSLSSTLVPFFHSVNGIAFSSSSHANSIPFRFRGHSIAITKRCRKPAVVILAVYCASRFSCSRGNHYLWQGALRTVYYPVAPSDERPNPLALARVHRRWRWLLVPMRPAAAKDHLLRLITRNHVTPSLSPKRDENCGNFFAPMKCTSDEKMEFEGFKNLFSKRQQLKRIYGRVKIRTCIEDYS